MHCDPPSWIRSIWASISTAKNPLGARALYLYKDGRDSMFRLHGTPEWWTIGTNVSSGCIRLINQDIIDLYNRAEVGAKVIVE